MRAPLLADKVLDRGERQPLQLERRGFQLVDFARAEAIACGFVPVAAVRRMKREAERREFGLPVRAGGGLAALHHVPMEPVARAELPNPPRGVGTFMALLPM